MPYGGFKPATQPASSPSNQLPQPASSSPTDSRVFVLQPYVFPGRFVFNWVLGWGGYPNHYVIQPVIVAETGAYESASSFKLHYADDLGSASTTSDTNVGSVRVRVWGLI